VTWHSVTPQIQDGGKVQAALGTSGLTNSAGTTTVTTHHLLTFGNELSHVDTWE